jgi:hypothetical protein
MRLLLGLSVTRVSQPVARAGRLAIRFRTVECWRGGRVAGPRSARIHDHEGLM